MTYVCNVCGHDYTEHERKVGDELITWPCDAEDCTCPDYEDVLS